MTHRPFFPIPGRQRKSGFSSIIRSRYLHRENHEIEIGRQLHRKGQRCAHDLPVTQQSDQTYETPPYRFQTRSFRIAGARGSRDTGTERSDLRALSAALLLKTSRRRSALRASPVPLHRGAHPPASIAGSGPTKATASHLAPTEPAPRPLPEEREGIKVSQLSLTSRISTHVEILGHSKDGPTRMWHWQADMDIQWKFRHRNGNCAQNGLERVAVGDPDPTADPGDTAHRPPTCGFEWTDESSRTLILPWTCTRRLGHQGQHLAGTGEWVAALHPQ